MKCVAILSSFLKNGNKMDQERANDETGKKDLPHEREKVKRVEDFKMKRWKSMKDT